MEYEIVESITTRFKNSHEHIIDCFQWLQENISNRLLKAYMDEWLEDHLYCPKCMNKLEKYEWTEAHTELDNNDEEYNVTYLCPLCDKGEM